MQNFQEQFVNNYINIVYTVEQKYFIETREKRKYFYKFPITNL